MLYSTLEAAEPHAQALTASPLMLSDRLITLAQDADRAGYTMTAEHLVYLAHTIFEEPRKLM